MKNLKYLAAYIIPVLMYFSLDKKGVFLYSVLIFAFVVIPIFEWILPQADGNIGERRQRKMGKKRFFDVLLYLNVPIVYGLLIFFLYEMRFASLTNFEIVGAVLSMGIVLATSGINVAHELGHRTSDMARSLSALLLLPSLYTHFTIEHNHGHHKRVGTPRDPATAKKNQSVYSFWFQSVIGGWLHAWKLERKRLQRQGSSAISLDNGMIRSVLIQLVYVSAIFYLLGGKVLILAILTAIVSFVLLETINYIEHYGLYRKKLENGRYERAVAKHSWNSNHLLGRIMLYELTRHSDHHYKASKKYQILDNLEGAPQLPAGYPGSMLMSLIPPLWFAKINPLLNSE